MRDPLENGIQRPRKERGHSQRMSALRGPKKQGDGEVDITEFDITESDIMILISGARFRMGTFCGDSNPKPEITSHP